MFAAPMLPPQQAAPPQAPASPVQQPMPQQGQPAGGGEFTRVFAAPAAPSILAAPPQQQAPQQQARPASKKKTNFVPLFIILGVLLVIAITLIVVFALRR
jgi:hypothetical protein